MIDPFLRFVIALLSATAALLSFTILGYRRGLFPSPSGRLFEHYRQKAYESGLPSGGFKGKLRAPSCEFPQYIQPGVRYAAYSIVNYDNDQWFFSKLEVLKNPSLLFEVSTELAQFIDSDDEWVCALGTSGIPVGVAISLISRLPLFFYKRKGFPKPGSTRSKLGPYALPRVPSNSRGVFADSHLRTGFSSALSYDVFTNKLGAKPTKMLLPLIFKRTFTDSNKRDIEYHALCDFSTQIGEVSACRGINNEKLTDLTNSPSGAFWQYPPFEIKRKPYALFDAPGLVRRPGWFIGRRGDISSIARIAPELSAYAERIGSGDEEIWRFFSDSGIVEMFARTVGTQVDLSDYDLIIGIGHLGTAFSIAVSYFNQDTFTGSILAHLGMQGLIPPPSDLAKKKILAIQMRVQTGVYAVDVFHRVHELQGELDCILTVFHPDKADNWIKRIYQTSIERLADIGISIVSLT